MKKLLTSLLVFSLGSMMSLANAATMSSPYHADVPVNSQTSEEQTQAMQKGLSQVLIKLSGNRHVIDNPAIKVKLKSAESLVEQFGYQRSQIDKPFLLQLE